MVWHLETHLYRSSHVSLAALHGLQIQNFVGKLRLPRLIRSQLILFSLPRLEMQNAMEERYCGTLRGLCTALHPRLHKATPISNGRRHNLILWCRSSGVRNDFCPMCFSQPNVVPTNRYYHEGFTVPPCEPAVMEASMMPTDMSSDDLYD